MKAASTCTHSFSPAGCRHLPPPPLPYPPPSLPAVPSVFPPSSPAPLALCCTVAPRCAASHLIGVRSAAARADPEQQGGSLRTACRKIQLCRTLFRRSQLSHPSFRHRRRLWRFLARSRQGVLPLIASVCDGLPPGQILSNRVAPCEQPAKRSCGDEPPQKKSPTRGRTRATHGVASAQASREAPVRRE